MYPADDIKSGPFAAYGAAIHTDLDLVEFLADADFCSEELVVVEKRGVPQREAAYRQVATFSGHGRSLGISTDRDFASGVQGQPWFFEVTGVVRFHWTSGADRIDYEILQHGEGHLIAFWLIHMFLPLYFTLEGRYEFIHAGAVEVDGETILFVAPSHGGKSTLTDYFIREGHVLVSDDKVATYEEKGTYFAVPSHPNHRPYREFEVLGRRVPRFDPRPRPIHAVYALEADAAGSDIRIEEIRGHAKFARLLPGYLFNFEFLQRRRLNYLAGLMNSVPFYRMVRPWDLGRLDDVYRAIREHERDTGG